MADASGIKFGKVANNPGTSTVSVPGAIEMGIKNAPSRLIVSYLTEMYSYPLEAALREAVSNALDACSRVGKGTEGVKASVDVAQAVGCRFGEGTRTYAIISDKGVGMDADTLVNVYTQYGVSDKRDDADTTGAFGLGAKAPLAYTNEMHVITRAAGAPTLYIHAYRTNDGDFLADTPVEVDGSFEAEDRLAVANGYVDVCGNTPLNKVSDPFGDGETGTVVMFPLAYADVAKASGILRSVDKVIYNTGGGILVDDSEAIRPAKPAYFPLGELELSDGEGTSIMVRPYLTEHDATADGRKPSEYALGTAFRQLFQMLAPDCPDGFVADCVAFKVGDWLYPANGNIWAVRSYGSYECQTSDCTIIIDVPSSALSFVPSRDAIISGSAHSNAGWIIDNVLAHVKENMQEPAFLASMFNWAMGLVGADTPGSAVSNMFADTGWQFDSAAIDGGMLRASHPYSYNRGKRSVVKDEAVYTMNLADMEFAGFSFAELYAMPNAMVGQVVVGANGPRMKYGPLVCSTDAASRLLGSSGKVQHFSEGERPMSTPGYGFAKTRKVADAVLAESEVSEYAEYQNRGTTDYAAQRKFGLPQAVFPAGIGLMEAYKEAGLRERAGSVVIVDGENHDIAKVRASIGAVFANRADMSDAKDAGVFAIIPPKEDGKWNAKEKEDFRKQLEKVAKSICDNVVYVGSSDLGAAMTKAANTKATPKRSELDRMFSINRVVSLEDPEADSSNKALDFDYANRKMEGLGALVAEDPSNWGIIITDDSKRSRSYERGSALAKLAFLLGRLPDYVTDIAIIGSSHSNSKRVNMLVAAGATIVYDETGESDVYAAYRSDEIDCNLSSVRYKGEIPEVISRQLDIDRQNANSSELARAVVSRFGRYVSFAKDARVNDFVYELSFGHEGMAPAGESELEAWKRDLVGAFSWEKHNQANAASNAAVAETSRRLGDVSEIWESFLARAGLDFRGERMYGSEKDMPWLSWLVAAGEGMGVKAAVDAYYSGVAKEDVLAARK